MTIVALEWVRYGLGRLVDAAGVRGLSVNLLTRDAETYWHELNRIPTGSFTLTEIETFDVETLTRHLRSVPDLNGVISATDTWSLVASELAIGLGLPGQSPRAVALVRDKASLRNCLYAHGLTRAQGFPFDPARIDPSELAGRLSYPSIVKDSAGTGSQNVWLVTSPSDAAPVLASAREAVLRGGLTAEPYFVGTLYSVETLTWAGESRILGVSSRNLSPLPHFREDSTAFPVEFPPVFTAKLHAWIREVLAAVGYTTGFAHTEFIITRDGIELVEINPRLAGGLIGEMICQALDVNIYDGFIDMALGMRPALMDLPLTPVRGAAEVILYPAVRGTFVGYRGTELLHHHPGDPMVYHARRPGETVESLFDVGGNTGSVFATGESSEIAMLNAAPAAGKLQIQMREIP